MSLSSIVLRRLAVALGNKKAAEEIAAAIDSNGSGPAATVAAFGATSNLSALAVSATTLTPAACAGGATPSATDVNAAIDALAGELKTALDLKADNVDAENLRSEAEARLDAIETKVNAIIAALKGANMMQS